jgi:cytoskeletal protein RodZ
MTETSLGTKLQDARLKRGMSILDAAHKTKIPAQRLQNLEADNYAAFGSMTYARAFVRQYSAFLGVSAEKTLEELPSGVLGGQRDYRYLVDSFGPWISQRRSTRNHAPRRPGAPRSAAASIVPQALVIFALILGGTGMFAKHLVFGREVEPSATAEAALTLEAVTTPAADAQPGKTDSPAEQTTNIATIKPVPTAAQPAAKAKAVEADSIDGMPIIARKAIPMGGAVTIVPGTNQIALPPTEILND